ncbi:hypothetical protein DY000_02032060 [Brassica cretica]|uniref:Uncharacterized protein n=1 Tax=Brassica cretica TaxID=69181 RepID=A0ABQ7DH68_BRACR|nr:hypothetical protein DY000_02032060 [Brassica cretica]
MHRVYTGVGSLHRGMHWVYTIVCIGCTPEYASGIYKSVYMMYIEVCIRCTPWCTHGFRHGCTPVCSSDVHQNLQRMDILVYTWVDILVYTIVYNNLMYTLV